MKTLLLALFISMSISNSYGESIREIVKHSTLPTPDRYILAANFAVRGLDAYTTVKNMNEGCYEKNLPKSWASSKAAMYSYSLGAAGVHLAASYLLFKKGHPKLARWSEIVDLGYDSEAVINNLLVTCHK